MKHPFLNLLYVAGIAFFPLVVSAQTGNNSNTFQQQQTVPNNGVSQQANQLLANPAVLFAQLDVDSDGLLNLNEFARISALSSQPVVTPVVDSTYNPNNGVPAATGPNGPYTPNTGVPAATTNGGAMTPATGVPPPNVRNSSAIPSRPAPPTRPQQ